MVNLSNPALGPASCAAKIPLLSQHTAFSYRSSCEVPFSKYVAKSKVPLSDNSLPNEAIFRRIHVFEVEVT